MDQVPERFVQMRGQEEKIGKLIASLGEENQLGIRAGRGNYFKKGLSEGEREVFGGGK